MSEQWRPVPGYEGLYEVSDHGRVRSLDRVVPHPRHGTMTVRGKVLATTTHRGRPHLTLARGEKRRQAGVHTLVLEAFVGPRPDGMEGCHGDGDPTNNHLPNLRWDTTSANVLDQVQHGVHRNGRKARCPRGHLLVEPNLVAAGLRRGQRLCRACARAATTLQRKGGTRASQFRAVADAFYVGFMGEGAGASGPQEEAAPPLLPP